MEFSHVGIVTDQPHAGEVFVEATRVWVTDFLHHPYRIEWLRFEADSPVTGPVRRQPHVGFRVDSIEVAARGLTCLLAPFHSRDGRRVGFYETDDGAVVELMEYRDATQ